MESCTSAPKVLYDTCINPNTTLLKDFGRKICVHLGVY